jgi:hypothetical protein
MSRPYRKSVHGAADDIRLCARAAATAISHLTSAIHSHVPLPPKLDKAVRQLRAQFGPIRHDASVLANDVELVELRAKAARRRKQKPESAGKSRKAA